MTYVRWGSAALVVAVTQLLAPGLASLLGALAGLLLELAVGQLGLIVGAVLFGLRVTHVIIGIGGLVKQWTSHKRRVVLRTIPLLVTVGLVGERTPVRARTVKAALVAIAIAVTTAAAAWLLPNSAIAIAATVTLLHQLVPRRSAGNTSLGWFVFGLPRIKGRELAEREVMPRITKAMDAFNAGDLDTSERIADELRDEYPELLGVVGVKTTTLCGRNRYAEALHLTSQLVGRPDLTPRETLFVMAAMAGLTAQAVDVGQLPHEVGVPAARRTIEGAIELGYPAYRANGTLALISLLEGDTDTAIELGGRAAEAGEQAVDRADDLTTVAKAYMRAGDNAKAREIMDEAHELAGWLPRIRATRERLAVQ